MLQQCMRNKTLIFWGVKQTMRFTSGRQKEHSLENHEVCIGIVLVMELINILLDVGGDFFKFCVCALCTT